MTDRRAAAENTISFERASLQSAMELFGSVVPSSAPKPELSCVRIRVGEGGITIEGTDLKTAVRASFPQGGAKGEGEWFLPAENVRAVVAVQKEDRVSFRFKDGCQIDGAAGSFRIPSAKGDGFPSFPEVPQGASFETPCASLARALRATAFCAARDRARYALEGIRLEQAKKQCVCVSTDGRRLAMTEWMADKGTGSVQAVIPLATAGILERWLSGREGVVTVKADERWMSAQSGDAIVVTRFLEGSFPDYRSVLPKEGGARWTIERKVLEEALRRAKLGCSQTDPTVDLLLGDGDAVARAESPEGAAARVVVGGEYRGGKMKLRMNPDFLLDFLRVAEASPLQVSVRDEASAVKIEAGTLVYVVMPKRSV